MNNLLKVILALVTGILLYIAFHVLAALLSLAIWVIAVVALVYCYNMYHRKKERNA